MMCTHIYIILAFIWYGFSVNSFQITGSFGVGVSSFCCSFYLKNQDTRQKSKDGAIYLFILQVFDGLFSTANIILILGEIFLVQFGCNLNSISLAFYCVNLYTLLPLIRECNPLFSPFLHLKLLIFV